MKLIRRAEVGPMVRAHWLATLTREELLATREQDWTRMRNYELEDMLRAVFGGEWIVNELCPFNGVFCAYGDTPEGLKIKAEMGIE